MGNEEYEVYVVRFINKHILFEYARVRVCPANTVCIIRRFSNITYVLLKQS